MNYYLTLLRLRDIASRNSTSIIRKGKKYLKAGQKPPKGAVTHRGPKGGTYYIIEDKHLKIGGKHHELVRSRGVTKDQWDEIKQKHLNEGAESVEFIPQPEYGGVSGKKLYNIYVRGKNTDEKIEGKIKADKEKYGKRVKNLLKYNDMGLHHNHDAEVKIKKVLKRSEDGIQFIDTTGKEWEIPVGNVKLNEAGNPEFRSMIDPDDLKIHYKSGKTLSIVTTKHKNGWEWTYTENASDDEKKPRKTKQLEPKPIENLNHLESAKKVLIGHSKNQTDYASAVSEWEYRGEAIDAGSPGGKAINPKKCHLCGHPIRWIHPIYNTDIGKVLEVGSECIGQHPFKFGDGTVDKKSAVKDVRAAKKARGEAAYQRISDHLDNMKEILDKQFANKTGITNYDDWYNAAREKPDFSDEDRKVINEYESLKFPYTLMSLSIKHKSGKDISTDHAYKSLLEKTGYSIPKEDLDEYHSYYRKVDKSREKLDEPDIQSLRVEKQKQADEKAKQYRERADKLKQESEELYKNQDQLTDLLQHSAGYKKTERVQKKHRSLGKQAWEAHQESEQFNKRARKLEAGVRIKGDAKRADDAKRENAMGEVEVGKTWVAAYGKPLGKIVKLNRKTVVVHNEKQNRKETWDINNLKILSDSEKQFWNIE